MTSKSESASLLVYAEAYWHVINDPVLTPELFDDRLNEIRWMIEALPEIDAVQKLQGFLDEHYPQDASHDA